MPRIKEIGPWLVAQSLNSVNSFGAQYDAFSVFIFLFFLVNPLKWQFNGPYSFSIIFLLRIIAVFLWIILALWRWWPKKCTIYLPLFWHFCLLYHLPFRTTFSLLYSPHSPSFDSFGLLSIVALAILVNDRMFALLTLFGSVCGCLVFFAFGGLQISLVKLVTLAYAGQMVISIAFIKFIFFRNHNISFMEKIKTNRTLAGAIAHEVRMPISIINLACEHSDINTIQRQSQRALRIVDSVLMQLRFFENNQPTICCRVPIQEAIGMAQSNIFFSGSDNGKIELDVPDHLHVSANMVLLAQVCTNLIKNALWATKSIPGGRLCIRAEKMKNAIDIMFIDNGVGIDKNQRKNLFRPFKGLNEKGAGIGLAFCKIALESMGGSIDCISQKGDYTCFVIQLKSAD